MRASSAVSLLTISFLAISACADGGETDSVAATAGTPADTQQRTGTPGMGGGVDMAGMRSAGMMDQVTSHMQLLQNMSADSMMAMVPAYRQQGEEMLAQMNAEMRDMSMQPDAQWAATADSVRQDMSRMADMSPAELQALLPGHRARMTRLMEMHRSMMSMPH